MKRSALVGIARRFGEQRQPTIEIPRVDRQRQMLGHGLTMITAAHQRDGRPEGKHLLQMRFPIFDLRSEDRTEIASSRTLS